MKDFFDKLQLLPRNVVMTDELLHELAVADGAEKYIEERAVELDNKYPGRGKYGKTKRGLQVEVMYAAMLRTIGFDVTCNRTAHKDKTYWWDFKIENPDIYIDVKITSRKKEAYDEFRTSAEAFADISGRGPGQFHHLGSHQSVHDRVYLLMVNMYAVPDSDYYLISPSWFISAKDFFERPGGYLLPLDETDKTKYRFRKENYVGKFVKFEY